MEITQVVSNNLFNDFTDIKNKYRISDDDFKNGLDFCVRLSSGENRVDTWKEVYGETANPSRDSSRFMKLQWISDILHKLYVSNHFEHVDTRHKILSRMSDIALDESASHKASIDAAKVFLESTNMPDSLHVDVDIDINDDAKIAMDAFVNTMKMISSGQAGLISKDGNIIDVKVIA